MPQVLADANLVLNPSQFISDRAHHFSLHSHKQSVMDKQKYNMHMLINLWAMLHVLASIMVLHGIMW